jgi:hypothetical protein
LVSFDVKKNISESGYMKIVLIVNDRFIMTRFIQTLNDDWDTQTMIKLKSVNWYLFAINIPWNIHDADLHLIFNSNLRE